MKKTKYGDDSISSLKGPDRVRKRPAVIFGSDGILGCQHTIFEILSNSIDEAREGFGNKIILTRYLDHSVEIEDFGRGIPVGWNEKEQKENWELLFCELYSGGKYNNLSGESYEFSLGINGLGLCATQYASEYMDATIIYDGKLHTLHFEKGYNVGGLQIAPATNKKTGTKIRWKPDLEVFTDINVSQEYFEHIVQKQAIVNPKVTFVFRNEVKPNSFETKEYYYENGILDYVEELANNEAFTNVKFISCERKGRDRADMPEYKLKINAAFCFSNKTQCIEYYHNSSFLEHGGAPEKAVKTAFVNKIDAYIRQNNKYLKNESKITFGDIEDCLILVTSCFSAKASYENQTKKAITNKFIQEAMTDFLKESLEIYFIENKLEADKIVDQVLANKRSREKSETMRLDIKKKLSGGMDLASRVQKFIDCRTKDVSKRELYIVEGDSALGACKLARNSEFQAIMPVRGKILNCLKAENDKIFKSEIITDLIKVLGCGVELKKKGKESDYFSLDNLRWDKIIICTDADVDGFHIRTMILTMIYRLMPTLISAGKVYIVESPLYEITCGKDTYFAYSDREKQEITDKLKDKKFTIMRSKGLGENEPEMMSFTTMHPATRRLIKVMPCDEKETEEMFNILLGDELQLRKEFIAQNGYKYLDDLDVS